MLQIKNTLGGGGKPEGLYVWKKHSIGFKYKEASVNKYENISIDTPQSGSIKVYASSSYTFDENTGMYTLVDPSGYSVELNGASTTFAKKYVTYKSPTSANMWIHNSINYGFQVYNYTSSGVTLNRNSNDYPIMAYSAETEPTYTFLDYIVSDKETAYPDGGEKGGYWYERFVERLTPELFGCTKMAIDEVTFSSRTLLSEVTFNHSLGEKPSHVIIVVETYPGSTFSDALKLMVYMNGPWFTVTTGRNDSMYGWTINATQLIYPTSGPPFYVNPGKKYKIITMV